MQFTGIQRRIPMAEQKITTFLMFFGKRWARC